MQKGRPREFDTELALDKALHVFWQRGYEGTSLTDLTEAMGISRPSLYAAFGNKEELFRLALDRYAKKGPGAIHGEALAEPTARKVVEHLLHSVAMSLTDPCNPSGCLAVQGALTCSQAADSIKRELCKRRSEGEDNLRKRFERAKSEGDLGPDSDPGALARYVITVTQGMSVQASGGATRSDLLTVVDMALKAWPA
ncbi:TetR/AcrR family transcriptional regulator [Hyphomicrobium sp.]|uniref:TetR/AcrR family transcriptional regulator n=1 Tax=Hyphomicrobium sp. TaxID=82 RepID=UPI000F97EA70|nr:TetR/AcrR family transcriptional regulator [Hyphomicrobium sp.]RUO98892.1 MAG: TetR/AcrR family transcriptional regulator [Hyphomicrobium sp.]